MGRWLFTLKKSLKLVSAHKLKPALKDFKGNSLYSAQKLKDFKRCMKKDLI